MAAAYTRLGEVKASEKLMEEDSKRHARGSMPWEKTQLSSQRALAAMFLHKVADNLAQEWIL